MHDEPVPVRRAALGCLVIAIVGLGIAALVRPAIFSLAPPRDDGVAIVGTISELSEGPIVREQLLSRAYGYDGERDAGDGRAQLRIIVAGSSFGGVSVLNAASPGRDGCPVEVGDDRLLDCDGRAWTFDGLPVGAADEPLARFPVEVDEGSIVVDFTRTLTD